MRSERHWSIYLPALSISILWAGILFWADRREPPLETLRLLALAVEVIAVPTLYLWAFYRARGAEISVLSDRVEISTGGRRPEKVSVDRASVGHVQIAQSYLQKLVGAGQVRVSLPDGRQFVLDDMSAPDRIVEAIRQDQEGVDKVSVG
ncbi:PH domain-containing protein [Parvibaculaceae bacterium PLY_AMNH_Bact1]|nr:PH domain-containing protein [Parvibaculaceae bacterium PLY_AMNH_Bact1]